MSITEPTWAPIARLDLSTASTEAFDDTVKRILDHSKQLTKEGRLPPFPFDNDGWYDITPQMSEAALLHTRGNRAVSLLTVRAYAHDMEADDWQATGESICGSEGKLDNGHHRLIAGYLSGQTFRCFVVVSVPATVPNLFAYFDSGKKRTAADALAIAGWNGAGKIIAQAITDLAIRYDSNILGVAKQKRHRIPNARDVLLYAQAHPDLSAAAHLMLGTYGEAVEAIRSKPGAVFFAWRVLTVYDAATLGEFCTPLGNGAMLEEDSPILAARARLLAPEEVGQAMPSRTRLAYVCKAFLMYVGGQKMPRARGGKVQPLSFELDEAFPRLDPAPSHDLLAAQ